MRLFLFMFCMMIGALGCLIVGVALMAGEQIRARKAGLFVLVSGGLLIGASLLALSGLP